ncbi:DUF6397 family protein [Streptomyces sp. NPDC005963]|uniref:DUF6397 family protein n=1 Tax=Streptomyces sp. NPDC005963 TaxID=3156721 RepID=UPI0033C97669
MDLSARDRPGGVIAFDRAAALLELRRYELELAVQLGYVRASCASVGRRRGFAPEELDRLRDGVGLLALRERVRTVGTVEGARLLSISPARFARLARTGHLVPVRFSLNRYRTVVWLYLVEEVKDFARDHPALLRGRTPPELRSMLESGEDRRPRNWRGRRLGLLLRGTDDPWRRAAIISSALDESVLAEMVPDPAERTRLHRLRPGSAAGRSRSTAAQEVVGRLARAVPPDEIQWHRTHLAQALREAREADSGEAVERPSSPTAEPGGNDSMALGDGLMTVGDQQEASLVIPTDRDPRRSPGGRFGPELRLVREPGADPMRDRSLLTGRHAVHRATRSPRPRRVGSSGISILPTR